MGMDLYKSRFSDGCLDGSGTKTKLYEPVSQIVRARVSNVLIVNVQIPAYLKGEALFLNEGVLMLC